jgi:hypothetical protein
MNVGALGGVVGSAAGAPLSQTAGNESERALKDASATQRQTESEKKTEKSAGIGQTEGDQAASDRDADGRRFWESSEAAPSEDLATAAEREHAKQSKDPSGNSGNALDLTG